MLPIQRSAISDILRGSINFKAKNLPGTTKPWLQVAGHPKLLLLSLIVVLEQLKRNEGPHYALLMLLLIISQMREYIFFNLLKFK